MRKVALTLVLLVPTGVFAGPWIEGGAGPWLPFFGAFNTNHNLGVEGKVRIGYDVEISLPDFFRQYLGPLGSASAFAPYVVLYHTWNSLKPVVWEVQDGDTVKSGNMLYVGIGGRIYAGGRESFTYGSFVSLGVVNEYAPSGNNIIGGGSHTPPKLSPSLFVGLFASYRALKPLYLFGEVASESLGSFSGGYTGWAEASVGVGLNF